MEMAEEWHRRGFSLSKSQFCSMAVAVAQRVLPAGHATTVKWKENGTPGDKWFPGFFKRHKSLSLRKADNLDHNRREVRLGNCLVLLRFGAMHWAPSLPPPPH